MLLITPQTGLHPWLKPQPWNWCGAATERPWLSRDITRLAPLWEAAGAPTLYPNAEAASASTWALDQWTAQDANTTKPNWTFPAIVGSNPITLFMVMKRDSGTLNAVNVGLHQASATGWHFVVTGGSLNFYSPAFSTAIGAGTIALGEWYAIVGVGHGAGSYVLIRTLSSGAISLTTGTMSGTLAATKLFIAEQWDGSDPFPGKFGLVGFCDGCAWTQQQALEWTADPFSILRPRRPTFRNFNVETAVQGHPAMRRWAHVPGMALTGRGW